MSDSTTANDDGIVPKDVGLAPVSNSIPGQAGRRSYKRHTHKGLYEVVNKDKYLGQKPTNYKSRWEADVFRLMDINPNIVEWGYECIDIFYHNPVTMKQSKYLPDIFCKVKNDDGITTPYLIEIKPAKFARMPEKPKPAKKQTAKSALAYQRRLQGYNYAIKDYMVNAAKWEAARLWCQRTGTKWFVLTEENTRGLFA